MRDRGLIWTGLAAFLALLCFPVWHNLFAHATAKGPEPALPKIEKQCVLPVGEMRTSHMSLLLSWRDTAIRQGIREYAAPDGRRFNISLTGTCLRQCHTERRDFCDRCHNYEAVALPCWDCHQDARPGDPGWRSDSRSLTARFGFFWKNRSLTVAAPIRAASVSERLLNRIKSRGQRPGEEAAK